MNPIEKLTTHLRQLPAPKAGGLRLLPCLVACCLAGWLLAAVTACTSIDCPVQNLVYTTYGLKAADGSEKALDTDTLWIWTHRADGTDTLLLNALCGSSATSFNLPISYTQPEDVLYTLVADTAGRHLVDTILIKKDNIPHFESVDCQAAYFHNLTAVRSTHNAIDSVAINHPYVTYDASNEHFHVYIKTDR